MTISTSSSQIQIAGNGAQTVFAFPFIGAAVADIFVSSVASNGSLTPIAASNFTVSLNAATPNQLWGVGGSVSYPVSGSPLPTGSSLLIQRILPYTQPTSVQNQGNYYAQVTEQALDQLEMQIQQNASRTTQFRGVWATGTVYSIGDIVQDGINGAGTSNYYICLIGNISGTWSTDLMNGDWGISVLATVPSSNQVITLSGAISGAGATSIVTGIPTNSITQAEQSQIAANTVVCNPSAVSANQSTLSLSANNLLGRAGGNIVALSAASVNSILGLGSIPTAISGFLINNIAGASNNATATISSGICTDSTNAVYISAASNSWAVTNGNAINGYSGGSTLPNSSTIHVYECSGISGVGSYAIPNASFPLSAVSAPAGYTSSVRRIGSFNTNSSGAPIPYISIETEGGSITNWLTTQLLDVSTTSLGTVRTQYTLTVPIGIKVQPQYRASSGLTTANIIFTSGDETDVAPAAGTGSGGFALVPGADLTPISSGGIDLYTTGSGVITTNTSGQIGARATAVSIDLYWVTRGFKDWRRG